MAYNESGNLSPSQDYTLGNYTFQLRSNYDGDEDVTGIVARMTINGQTSVKGIDVDGQATVESWSVEANESTADVYANVGIPKEKPGEGEKESEFKGSGNFPNPISYTSNSEVKLLANGAEIARFNLFNCYFAGLDGTTTTNPYAIMCADNHEAYAMVSYNSGQSWRSLSLQNQFTYGGKTAYYHFWGIGATVDCHFDAGDNASVETSQGMNSGATAWTILYGTPVHKELEYQEYLIGRFAIDLKEADPEEWDEPIDYEEGWEEGDPTHTLKVTIKGATSGRHNDPLNDPSYSYLPADNTTVKPYGSGGDGGFGGGGGAGASTVIVYKFATDKANSKEVTAIARGHGYGSGGGKGGKGGDGCIIVYY